MVSKFYYLENGKKKIGPKILLPIKIRHKNFVNCVHVAYLSICSTIRPFIVYHTIELCFLRAMIG